MIQINSKRIQNTYSNQNETNKIIKRNKTSNFRQRAGYIQGENENGDKHEAEVVKPLVPG